MLTSRSAIHDGSLAKAEFTKFGTFDLSIPKKLEGVPDELLDPEQAWPKKDAFIAERKRLAGMFTSAFEKYANDCSPEVRAAGPKA